MERPDIIVVGGGIIGCAVAHACARAGASVVVLERDTIAAHASSAAAGMLAPISESTELPNDDRLLHVGMPALEELAAVEPELAEHSGIVPSLRRMGIAIVRTSAGARDLIAAHARLVQHGVELLDRDALHKRIPGLAPDLDVGLWSPREGAVDAGRLTRAYAGAAMRRGARLVEGACVREIVWDGDRAIGVRTADRSLHAQEIVWCTGAWAGASSELPLPVEPLKGQLIAVEPRRAAPDVVVWGEGVYLVPPGDGSLKIGATVERVGFDVRPTAGAVADLTLAAGRVIPALRDARFLGTWAALRPTTPDHLPLVGRHPTCRGLTLAVGHHRNGILLSELTARLVTEALLEGAHTSLHETLSPARLLPAS